MIVIKFGRWGHAALKCFVYDRIFWKGFKWTPFCKIKKRTRACCITNADRIRNMTNEELYEFLSMWGIGDIDYSVTFCDLCKDGGNTLGLDCDGCRRHWLESDADEYNGLNQWFKAGERNDETRDY